MTSVAALKQRWTSPTGRTTAVEVLRLLQAGQALDGLGCTPSTAGPTCAASRLAPGICGSPACAANVATTIFALLRRPMTPGVSALLNLLNLRDLPPHGAAIGEVLVVAGGVRQG